MSLATDAGLPASTGAGSPRRLVALATAAAVGLLVAGTLGTLTASIVGTALDLLGAPDDWAMAAAGITAALSLLPSAALARRVWLVECERPDS